SSAISIWARAGSTCPAFHSLPVAKADESQPAGGPGDGDVEVSAAARGRLLDPGRVDDDHRVEFEPLGLLGGEHHDRCVEIWAIPVERSGDGQRGGGLGDAVRRRY